MSPNLSSKYISGDHEDKIYKLWEDAKVFAPKEKTPQEETFSIVMPPPNANGSLHVGHAVFVTLEDLMVRYHRMKGDATVWLPGLDHAGFETQVVFEKYLEKQGESRFNMSREELYDRTLAFTKQNSGKILEQFKKLGASADWNRLKFTLDPDVVDLVYETFIKLYEDGLAYREKRPVHWCTKHQTTLSDLEVKDREQADSLYYIKYGPLTIATVRPETIFGDVAVAVNPEDPRYKKYIGTEIEVDFGIETRKIPVIGDDAVSPDFGTGALKVTPAHDQNDFEIAIRHNLPINKIAINEFGRLTDIAGKFAGLKIDEARQEVVALLQENGLVEKIEEYKHTVKTCYKCERTIEPRVIDQWFIAVTKKGKNTGKSLANDAIQAVSNGQVQFVTESFHKIFNHWMENIRDWNISRQIVWGIRLPVWYCSDCGQTVVKKPSTSEVIIMRHGESEHNKKGIGNGDPAIPSHLTSEGKEQMFQVKNKLGDFDEVYVSEFIRTQESAEIIAPKIKPKIDKRINDISYGGLEGAEIGELHFRTDYHQKSIEGSETYPEVEARVESFLRDIVKSANQNKKRILIITSEAIFWALRTVLNPQIEIEEKRQKVDTGEYLTFSMDDFVPCQSCNKISLKRDPDVFDTWFSSGQWPVIVPKTTAEGDFNRFYPTQVMETGWDILFFWVARMIMLSLYLTDEVPFKNVYLHGMVRDKDRQKMSKSKGNVMDPLAVIEDYGADALRMALIFGTSAGRDMPMGEEKVRGMRNFTNKLWNIARFILMNFQNTTYKIQNTIEPITEADTKIIESLKKTIKNSTQNFDEFRFHESTQQIYHFIWHEFADIYIESSKKQLTDDDNNLAQNTQNILVYCLVNSLKLLHPIMPFVTETIWQELPKNTKDSELLIKANWPGA